MSKTNFEYLKDICVGNDEALEFIEAAENDYNSAQLSFKTAIAEKEDEYDELEDRIEVLEKKAQYTDEIDAGIGMINGLPGTYNCNF